MKTSVKILVFAILLGAIPNRSFALWEVETVSPARAKTLGMEVQSTSAGPDRVTVKLEFTTDGELENISRVELRVGQGANPPIITAPLRAERSKPGRVAVQFTADRSQLEQLSLWVKSPGILGGIIYDFPVKNFVEPEQQNEAPSR